MSFIQTLFGNTPISEDAQDARSRTAMVKSFEAGSVPTFKENLGWFSGFKSIFRRIGVTGRLHYPSTDTDNLVAWHRKNELAYACIEKIAQTAIDPELIVETRASTEDTWKRDDTHPLRRLFMRPNYNLNSASFLARWLVMLHVVGVFRARIYRNDIGLPARLVPVLPPAKLIPVISGQAGTPPLYYEYQDSRYGIRENVPIEDVFEDAFFDPQDEYNGLSPLAVALGSIDMDAAQTEYVRAFFDNGGVPSGVIKVKKTLTPEESEGILQRWMRKYQRNSRLQNAPAVFDEDGEYQRIGANLNELASDKLSERAEAKVCQPFGVPPILAGAVVGLKYQNNRASAKQANQEFWDNKMSPLYKRIRGHVDLTLLMQYEGEDRIAAGLVRTNWDMSQVSALQEDVNSLQERARKNLQAGGITLDEYREKIGEKPLENDMGKVYFVPNSVRVVKAEELGAQATPTPAVKSVKPPRDIQDKAQEWWETNAPEDARGLITARSEGGGAVS